MLTLILVALALLVGLVRIWAFIARVATNRLNKAD
jgi:hypothetical protein